MEEIIEGRVQAAKAQWMEEQQEIRRREREEIEAGHQARDLATAPLGTLNFGLTADELRAAVLELLRTSDDIALQHLLRDAAARAVASIDGDDFEAELGQILDKIAAIGALALEYDRPDLLTRTVYLLTELYSYRLTPEDDRRYGLNAFIDPEEKPPRIFLAVIERIYGLGALAIRLERWQAVRELTLQRPARVDNYWRNWLRHASVMASRAQQLRRRDEGGRAIEISLLTRAAAVVDAVPALHPDTSDQDVILTSLAQFDLLSNLVAIDGADRVDTSDYYTNWARFRQERIQPIADRVLNDPQLRRAVFSERGDDDLAVAFRHIGRMASQEAMRYDGFFGWGRTPVGDLIENNPEEPAA
jgi:hypothetical protein